MDILGDRTRHWQFHAISDPLRKGAKDTDQISTFQLLFVVLVRTGEEIAEATQH